MRHQRWIFLSWIAVALLATPGVRAADRFYENLLRDGVLAADRGEAQRAARLLRLACFGLLDEPPLLARCLTHLALAQASLDDSKALLATFQRLLEIEQRFTAYSRADLSDLDRQRFESALRDMVPAETLARSSPFAHLVPRSASEEPAAGNPEPARRGEDVPAPSPPELPEPAPSPPELPEPAVEPAPPPADPPPEVVEAIARARETRSAGSSEAVASELAGLRPLAEAHPGVRELQLLAAELAYRLRRWDESLAYFARAGEIGPEQPALAFYYAVALYETGSTARAAEVLGRCLPRLRRSPFVDGYVEKILGPDASR